MSSNKTEEHIKFGMRRKRLGVIYFNTLTKVNPVENDAI